MKWVYIFFWDIIVCIVKGRHLSVVLARIPLALEI